MSELSFFGTWQDSWNVLDAIAADPNIRFVPGVWYPTSTPEILDRVSPSLQEKLREKRQLFLWSVEFSVRQPVLERQDLGPRAGQYFVRSTANSCLELTLPACYEEDGIVVLGSGLLSHPSRVRNSGTGRMELPSAALRRGYAAVCERVRQVLLRHRMKQWIWIGSEALRLAKEGKARIQSPYA